MAPSRNDPPQGSAGPDDADRLAADRFPDSTDWLDGTNALGTRGLEAARLRMLSATDDDVAEAARAYRRTLVETVTDRIALSASVDPQLSRAPRHLLDRAIEEVVVEVSRGFDLRVIGICPPDEASVRNDIRARLRLLAASGGAS